MMGQGLRKNFPKEDINYIFGDKELRGEDISGFTRYSESVKFHSSGRLTFVDGGDLVLPRNFFAYSTLSNGNIQEIDINLFTRIVILVETHNIMDIFSSVYNDDGTIIRSNKEKIISYYQARRVSTFKCGLFMFFDRIQFAFPYDFFELSHDDMGGTIRIVRRKFTDILEEMSRGEWPKRGGVDYKFSKLITDVGCQKKNP
jgi:hypothetical protein